MSHPTSGSGKASTSILDRASSTPQNFLSENQSLVDRMVSHGVDEATNVKTLAAVTGAGLTSRFIRIGSLNAAAPLLSSGRAELSLLLRAGASGTALLGESAVFAGMNRTLQPSGPPRSFAQDWMKSAVDLGCLKGFGALASSQNLILRHLAADLGLVAGENLAASFKLTAKPNGNLAQQMLEAEALNLSLGAGLKLLHGLAPGLDAASKSADLLASTPNLSAPKLLTLPHSRILAPEGPSERMEGGPEKLEPMQMSGSDRPGSPMSVRTPIVQPQAADFDRVRHEFGDRLLTELFGREKEAALSYLTTLFANRPDLRQKYTAAHFANANFEARRTIFRALVDDSLPSKAHPQNLSRTQVHTSFFNQALSLFILFKDTHASAFHAHQRQTLLKGLAANPSPAVEAQGSIPGTRPLPPEFMQPNLLVAGEKLPILTHFRGHYELGRAHFLGDPTVSLKHLHLIFNMGLWYLADARSTYGTYYYDREKKSWEAYRNDHWSRIQSMDLLNIGSGYYRLTVMGGMVHFEPTAVPPGIEPNRIRRFSSVTWDTFPFRVELNSTPRGEAGGVQIGNTYFHFERGRCFVLNFGEVNELNVNGMPVPPAVNPHTGEVDFSRRTQVKNGDRLNYQGQTYQVQISESGDVQLFKISQWVNFVAPPSEPIRIYDWNSNAEPTVENDTIRMGRASELIIGRLGKKDTLKPLEKQRPVYGYSLEDKPWFRSPRWIRIEKMSEGEVFRVTNLGPEGLSIENPEGRVHVGPVPIAPGNFAYLKPEGTILYKGRQLRVIP